MTRPTFSIILANFRSGPKLRQTAESILGDPFADLELLIIDAASTDESLRDAVELLQANRDRIRLVSQKDAGIYDAMNNGVGIARGRYVFFIGAGDLLKPGVLATIAAELPPGDAGLVYGDVIRDGRRYDGPFDRQKLTDRNVCHQAIFYGRELFRRHGEYRLEYRYLADWEFNLRLWGDRAVRPKWVDVVVADYEGGGVSDANYDSAFNSSKERLILRHFGVAWCALHYRRPIIDKAMTAIRRRLGKG